MLLMRIESSPNCYIFRIIRKSPYFSFKFRYIKKVLAHAWGKMDKGDDVRYNLC